MFGHAQKFNSSYLFGRFRDWETERRLCVLKKSGQKEEIEKY